MTPAELEAYLREHIPLSAAIGVRVVASSDDRVVLEAPLEPNLNHRATAFGGSVSATAILAGWTWLHLRLRTEGRAATTVIQESNVRYHAPIRDAFRAVAEPADERAWSRFTRMLERYGRGRIRVAVRVMSDGVEAARFEGNYVSFASATSVAASMSWPPS